VCCWVNHLVGDTFRALYMEAKLKEHLHHKLIFALIIYIYVWGLILFMIFNWGSHPMEKMKWWQELPHPKQKRKRAKDVSLCFFYISFESYKNFIIKSPRYGVSRESTLTYIAYAKFPSIFLAQKPQLMWALFDLLSMYVYYSGCQWHCRVLSNQSCQSSVKIKITFTW
jgi:hypothetical protein